MSEQTTAPSVAAGRWQLDPAESTASFTVIHFGRPVVGTIPLRAAAAEIGPTGDILSGHIELDIAAIATGNSRRDSDLAKPRFLDTAQHPTMLVDVAPVSGGEGCWRPTATLQARGMEVGVELVIEMPEPATDDVAKVLVTGNFDRTPLGIKVPGFIIVKNIAISVEAVFRRVSP
jgi:polyisoprenoid-binding protein YceI